MNIQSMAPDSRIIIRPSDDASEASRKLETIVKEIAGREITLSWIRYDQAGKTVYIPIAPDYALTIRQVKLFDLEIRSYPVYGMLFSLKDMYISNGPTGQSHEAEEHNFINIWVIDWDLDLRRF